MSKVQALSTWAAMATLAIVAADRAKAAKDYKELAETNARRCEERDHQFAALISEHRSLETQFIETLRERDAAVRDLERLRGTVNRTDVLRSRITSIISDAGEEGSSRGPIMAKLSRPQRENAPEVIEQLVVEGVLTTATTDHGATRYYIA